MPAKKVRYLFVFIVIAAFLFGGLTTPVYADILEDIGNLLRTNNVSGNLGGMNAAELPPKIGEQLDSETESAEDNPIKNSSKEWTIRNAKDLPFREEEQTGGILGFFRQIADSLEELLGLGNRNATQDVNSKLPPGFDKGEESIQNSAMTVKLGQEYCANSQHGIGICSGEDNSIFAQNSSASSSAGTGEFCTASEIAGSQNLCNITSDKKDNCYWANFLPYFNGDEQNAKIASAICSLESDGNAFSVNKHCLATYSAENRTRDYSVGLFQINLLAHQKTFCGEDVLIDDWENSKTCHIISGKEAKLQECVSKLQNVQDNINAMKVIYQNAEKYQENGWLPWSTYTQTVSKCTNFVVGTLDTSLPMCAPVPADCPDPKSIITVPKTQYRRLGKEDCIQGCMKPSMVVIHWSGAWTTAEATYNTLQAGKTDSKTGLFYRNGCQFATDTDHQLQMENFWNGIVEWGYCVGGKENAMSINDEITGRDFDNLVDNNYNLIPTHPRYAELKAETDRSITTTCWVLSHYNIDKSQIYGHFETPYGRERGKPDPGVKYIKYYRNRVNSECH